MVARCFADCRRGNSQSRQRIAGDARVEGGCCNVLTAAVAATDEDEHDGQDSQPDKDDDEHDDPLPMVRPPRAALVIVI